jgi:hypothetical protein
MAVRDVLDDVLFVLGPDALFLVGAVVPDPDVCPLDDDASDDDRAFCWCGVCAQDGGLFPNWA